MTKRASNKERIRAHALSLPGAYEDFPWGERVVKVNKKVFVFLGMDDGPHGMSVKLKDSNDQALLVRGAQPTGYGLGRGGWVDVPLGRGAPPLGVLIDWLEESYRLVAPKRISAQLDGPPPKKAKKKR